MSPISNGHVPEKHGRQWAIGLHNIVLIVSQTKTPMRASKDQASQLNDNATTPGFTACSLRISEISTSFRRCQKPKATRLMAYHKRKQYALLTWSIWLRQSHQNHDLS